MKACDAALRTRLECLGLAPSAAWFGDTAIFVGWRVTLDAFSVVLRRDDSEIVATSLAARQAGARGRTAEHFGAFVRRLLRAVPDATAVRGMILPCLSDPALQRTRSRLVRQWLAQGAQWTWRDDERWLIFQRETMHADGASEP